MKMKTLGVLGIALFSLGLGEVVYGEDNTAENSVELVSSKKETQQTASSQVSLPEENETTDQTPEIETEPEVEEIIPEEQSKDLRGWQSINGKWYFYNEVGEKAVGWKQINQTWYYFEGNGKMVTGWLNNQDGQHRFYLNQSGAMVTGWQSIENHWYYFAGNGSVERGWLLLNNRWFYLEEDGTMAEEKAIVNGQNYLFDKSGVMLSNGWKNINGTWYYLQANGAAQTGWFNYNGAWYYLFETGEMKTGWQQINNKWYFLNPSGNMAQGWLQYGGVWYYLKDDGSMAVSWQMVKNIWYHFAPDGRMETGWFTDTNGKRYLLNEGGALVADAWGKVDDSWYYIDSQNQLAKGWNKINGVWYYFDNEGKMQTGWQQLNGDWYYLNPTTGAMYQNAWLHLDNKYYYILDNGHMVTGTLQLGSDKHSFAIDGTWLGSTYQNPAGYLQVQDTQIQPTGEVGYNLSYGFEGIKTYLVQHRLGIYDGRAFYGSNTTSAVKMFQASKGLSTSGEVDFETWKALGLNPSLWTEIDSYIAPLKVTTKNTREEHIEAMIQTAYSYLGNEYIIGASTLPQYGVDCSGLVMQALYSAGINPAPISSIRHAHPGYEYESRNLWADKRLKTVSYNDRQRGDLVFYYEPGTYSIWHVGIYLGNDMVIDSWPPKVQVAPLVNWQRNVIAGFKRPFQ